MDFLLRAHKKEEISFRVEYISELKSIDPQNGVLYIEKLRHLDYRENNIENRIKEIIAGDIINYKSNIENENKDFFYIIKCNEISNTIEFYSDYQSFLPIYYYEGSDYYLISSSVDTIYTLLKELEINKDFITEMALLNDPFQDSCFFKKVMRINYSFYQRIDRDKLMEIRTKRFYEKQLYPIICYFCSNNRNHFWQFKTLNIISIKKGLK